MCFSLASSPDEVANGFISFFHQIVSNIRSALDLALTDYDVLFPPPETKLSVFSAVTIDDVSRLLREMKKKSCELDVLPSWLLGGCAEVVAPYLATLINDSLANGYFPSEFKSALTRPLLKKPSLDPTRYRNYRPVLNLSFISKLSLVSLLRTLPKTTSQVLASLPIVRGTPLRRLSLLFRTRFFASLTDAHCRW